jgi:hypothetical protein
MSAFDLLFIAVFLATAVTLFSAAVLALRGRGACRSRAPSEVVHLRRGVSRHVVLSSVFWPRTVLEVGDRRCFDDWCIAVEKASRQEAQGGVSYLVTLRLSSSARRVTQRENNVVVYLADQGGHRYDPVPDPSAVAMNVQLGPQESVTATRSFRVPAEARELGLVIDHEGGFPIGWFILGDETWFHKPTIVRLNVS